MADEAAPAAEAAAAAATKLGKPAAAAAAAAALSRALPAPPIDDITSWKPASPWHPDADADEEMEPFFFLDLDDSLRLRV